MAKGLKSKGIEEVRELRARVIRQHSLNRISRVDRDKLVDLLDKFEAHVVYMKEQIDDEKYNKEL